MTAIIYEGCTDVPTEQEAVFLAHLDYDLLRGTRIRVSHLSNGESDWVGDFIVMLYADVADDSIEHWNDEYLDPYWDVIPVNDAAKAALGESRETSDFEFIWTHGPSYRVIEPSRSQ